MLTANAHMQYAQTNTKKHKHTHINTFKQTQKELGRRKNGRRTELSIPYDNAHIMKAHLGETQKHRNIQAST